MLGGCYVSYFYFYFALRSKIFSEKVCKPTNNNIKGLNYKNDRIRMIVKIITVNLFLLCIGMSKTIKKCIDTSIHP